MSSAVKLYKPKPVKTAVNVLAVALILGLVMLGLEYSYLHSGVLEKFTPIYGAAAYGILILLIILVSSGQGWGRFLLAAYLIAALVLAGPTILMLFAKNPMLGALAAGQLLLILISLVLLFGARANDWYKS